MRYAHRVGHRLPPGHLLDVLLSLQYLFLVDELAQVSRDFLHLQLPALVSHDNSGGSLPLQALLLLGLYPRDILVEPLCHPLEYLVLLSVFDLHRVSL